MPFRRSVENQMQSLGDNPKATTAGICSYDTTFFLDSMRRGLPGIAGML